MAATNSTSFPTSVAFKSHFSRDLGELTLGFAAIILVLWLPTREQLIFGPIALLAPLVVTLFRYPGRQELGLTARGFLRSLWILPASIALTVVSVLVAQRFGTFHALYQADFKHVGGYVLWTIYQQFLLQGFFMPRLTRLLKPQSAIVMAGILFSAAHLPSPTLTLATLVWGLASCWLFRRYRSLWVLGLAQGLLGLAFAVCVPDALHHHMRVGLGFLRYHAIPAGQPAPFHGTLGK
ncbi:MAG: CPBP family intramembrane glutamic endopeptidase [Candidatus Sulfotelmatobacter sp.]